MPDRETKGEEEILVIYFRKIPNGPDLIAALEEMGLARKCVCSSFVHVFASQRAQAERLISSFGSSVGRVVVAGQPLFSNKRVRVG